MQVNGIGTFSILLVELLVARDYSIKQVYQILHLALERFEDMQKHAGLPEDICDNAWQARFAPVWEKFILEYTAEIKTSHSDILKIWGFE